MYVLNTEDDYSPYAKMSLSKHFTVPSYTSQGVVQYQGLCSGRSVEEIVKKPPIEPTFGPQRGSDGKIFIPSLSNV